MKIRTRRGNRPETPPAVAKQPEDAEGEQRQRAGFRKRCRDVELVDREISDSICIRGIQAQSDLMNVGIPTENADENRRIVAVTVTMPRFRKGGEQVASGISWKLRGCLQWSRMTS